ncbi:MAG: ATP-binding protein, partial [Acidobacteria bacterium]|nr:ATP-binding protein [Acidobacteriota bacterium]
MSLKSRLRLFIVVLMVSVVSALSALNMYSLIKATFNDILQRSENTSQMVTRFIVQRVKERMSDLDPRPKNFDEVKAAWTDIVSGDQEIRTFLENTMSGSHVIVEIVVTGEDGRILVSSNPSRIGQVMPRLPDLAVWDKKSPWGKLADIFSHRQDYEVTAPPLGLAAPRKGSAAALPAETQKALFTIKVLISSVLLRSVVLPQIQSITLIFLGSLLLSMLLAIIVSNLALRPLDTISQAIDRISRGEFGKGVAIADAGSAKEFTAVQSKLNLLGQQFRGAREDAIQLRTNIEQLLERLEEVVLLFDREDRLVMAGRAAEQLLGRGRWEMLGRTLVDLFPPSTTLGAAVQGAIELRQPLKDRVLTLERDGSTPVRLLVNIEMLESFPSRDRIGTLMTLRDAETRRQIQSQLDISARLAAISRLTGGVAHEIKNPLNAIAVHLEVLRSKLASGSESVDPEIDTIAREITRLDRVVKTFLDFTRPVDLKMSELDMVTMAREVASLVGPSAERQQVQISVAAKEPGIFVHGDRDLLKQAMLNIVVNGIEAMKSGGRLQIQLRHAGSECALDIADEGPGISPEVRDKIFNLYFS